MKCSRCGREENCTVLTVYKIVLCEACLELVVLEWRVKFDEFGELIQS
jgi:hypothetical protein